MCRNGVSWLYRAEKSFIWDSGLEVDEDRVFLDAAGKVRLIIETTGRITVTRGYSWNGCSPKVCVFDFLLGTPDGVVHKNTGRPKTYFASMVHDALYQFLKTDSPIGRKQADDCFLRLMEDSDFSPRYLYWAAVRIFGRLVWRGKQMRRGWQGRSLPVAALLEQFESTLAV
jgi:hypothetical protein